MVLYVHISERRLNVTIIDIILLLTSIFLGAIALLLYFHFKNQQKEYQAQIESMKEQSYEIVHELRAPLNAIKDAAILLNDMPGKLTPDEQTKMLSLLKNECARLLEQVTSFLDASKAISSKLNVQKTPNDLKNLLQDKILMFNAQANANGLQLHNDIDPQLPLIMYDPKYMNQVMNNLISNSLKYTPSGGTITIRAKTVDNNIAVEVFDNGLGVPDEKQKALFTKFASLNSKNSAIASSGLGLYVVKGIVEAHGGKVTVNSHEGRGYKISFTLPMQALPASLVQSAGN